MTVPQLDPNRMDIDGLFHSPEGRIAAFSQMQVHLYRDDPSLQDYFEPLQLDALERPRVKLRDLRTSSRFAAWAVRAANQASRLRLRRRIKTDILLCPNPVFTRKAENRFFLRVLLGLARTGAKILCLLPEGAPCRGEWDAQLEIEGYRGQVTFLDPAAPSDPIDRRLHWRAAGMRAHSAFKNTIRILEPLGLSVSREVEIGFERTAHYVEAWERLAPSVDFDAVVARCHWHALCSPVCRAGLQRGKRVIAFQQGVIGHTLDAPVTASKFVAFGQASASFLARMNRSFFRSVERPEPPVEYVLGGCLFDALPPLPDQFDRQTLLLVDSPMPKTTVDFYGIKSQCHGLLQLADRLLSAGLPLRQVVIRPHPYWTDLDFEACQRLVREHGNRCELSHPIWSLEDDLRRSSVVVGILSGVLTVASACGVPSIFLETQQGFWTGDLACFSPRQTLHLDAAFSEIGSIVSDRRAYAEARTEALRNARQYYANGTNPDLSAAFFERLLQNGQTTGQPGA